jgi:hypothetical protein
LEEDFDKVYNQFMVDRFLSYCPDIVSFVNDVAPLNLPKKAHYYCYLHGVFKKKRYIKYPKKEDMDNIETLKKYFVINENKARDIIPLLQEDVINNMKKVI